MKMEVIVVKTQTIAAISTAMSDSGIGIVRMSGDEAFTIVDKIYEGKNGKRLSFQKSHTIHYGFITDEHGPVDEVLVMIMRGPHSYTGEDTVEVNCHGGVYLVKRVLEIMIENGARPAEPGEFTKRAFLNGRLDLSQAEAVGDLIASQNEYALKSSVSQLRGNVKSKISDIRNEIIYHTAFIETALDDPEHISVDGYSGKLKETVVELLSEIDKLLSTCNDGRIIKEGIKTVIVGKPNAGKSSLLNALVGEERAIVTEVAGTTRDILEEHINLQGISLNILDTAGIRDTDDIVERIGVDKARLHADEADLVIYVIDASAPLDENDTQIFKMICGKPVIILLNKSDLDMMINKDKVLETYYAINPANTKCDENKEIQVLEVSAKNQCGIGDFEKVVKDMFFEGNLSFNNEIYITNVRHKAALQDARNSLKKVIESIDSGMPEDFYSIDLLDAYESLGSITGDTMGEDLINEIFSKFCMGK
ncbi:tRNA uridine-5-carboxymethylaminomethyl(34) synthesis GTPase MnmE [Extibacter muris]|uniref:tRNA uridine-5-carboxymethylaminomethyl(34) synthesis GTPase MnmE n=1 Tax=Extibacter muris TaxID=1796622 RepID=UPI001D090F9E|nr:tRNA uridine-5-carboxymethylaminomethyl(34) synthesis GTPase MnmE [Extibacter muris]MCB6201246.1 tRNA uridine-5-carboxymethylaminomethyl(34) synthesis GTPase MnmE [Extibacter muris]MCQ4664711.1 tRNA uridine-5-carboxymethylaminomethyl(34) synthesis GTPase MnmE [Extibacter muris]MCQ4694587.1 tRNA uridine-5-carboxymethylaminomethyl(34) synthesis GTPase MnmE [Extibacter muris]